MHPSQLVDQISKAWLSIRMRALAFKGHNKPGPNKMKNPGKPFVLPVTNMYSFFISITLLELAGKSPIIQNGFSKYAFVLCTLGFYTFR